MKILIDEKAVVEIVPEMIEFKNFLSSINLTMSDIALKEFWNALNLPLDKDIKKLKEEDILEKWSEIKKLFKERTNLSLSSCIYSWNFYELNPAECLTDTNDFKALKEKHNMSIAYSN